MYLGIAIVVILAAVIINTSMAKARQEARTTAYEDLRKASAMQIAKMDKTEVELQSSLSTIDDLVANSQDPNFKINALFEKANLASNLAQRGMAGSATPTEKAVSPEQAKQYLADARAAYEQIVQNFSDHTLYYGRALYGLFQVEAQAFVLDGDAAHEAKAKEYLEKLRDDSRFNATPLQTIAIERLKNLDAMFTAVTFPPRPAAPARKIPINFGKPDQQPGPVGVELPPAATPAPAATEGTDNAAGQPDAEASEPKATEDSGAGAATEGSTEESQDAKPEGE